MFSMFVVLIKMIGSRVEFSFDRKKLNVFLTPAPKKRTHIMQKPLRLLKKRRGTHTHRQAIHLSIRRLVYRARTIRIAIKYSRVLRVL